MKNKQKDFLNKHQEKIRKARAKNPLEDYFLNSHFEEDATEKEKKFVEDHFEFITISGSK